jgi:1-acyl-sn-glycerol-3-phosphate acyltransferase
MTHRMNWLYRLGWYLVRAFFFGWFGVKVEGVENVPPTGPVLLCANHISNLDPPLLGAMIPRPISFMAKASLFKVPVLGLVISRYLGAFPVQRGTADRAALRTALQILAEGRVFGIFPEGTRSKTGELGQARTGVAFIAMKSGAPVVPVAISGPYRFRRGPVVRIGKPLDLSKAADAEGNLEREAVAEYIWQSIAELLETTPRARR